MKYHRRRWCPSTRARIGLGQPVGQVQSPRREVALVCKQIVVKWAMCRCPSLSRLEFGPTSRNRGFERIMASWQPRPVEKMRFCPAVQTGTWVQAGDPCINNKAVRQLSVLAPFLDNGSLSHHFSSCGYLCYEVRT